MYIEHFDKCSDLKNFVYENSDPDSMTDKCAELEDIYDDYVRHSHLYEHDETTSDDEKKPFKISLFDFPSINTLRNTNINDFNASGLIFVFIFIVLIANVYIAIPLVPFMVAGSFVVSLCVIVLAISLLFLIYYLFS